MSTVGPKVIWAKLPGFPHWPGRYCSHFEEKDLCSMIPAKDKQVAIVFFEKKIKKAWVNESSVKEFIVSNLFCGDGSELFTPKTFESNVSYRLAIMEAVRILHPSLQNMASTETLDKGLLLALKLIRKYEPNYPTKTLDDKVHKQVNVQACEICYGTYCSGELRNCCNDVVAEADCEAPAAVRCGGKSWVHYHCLQPNGGVDIDERWFCTPCCQSYGWLPHRLLPADDSLVPFFGVVDRFLPPSGLQEHDQLYHVTFEDGDGEEYFENELHDVMTLFDEFRSERYNFPFRTALLNDRTNWACSGKKHWTKQHPSVGIRVCKYFAGDLATLSAASFANDVPLAAAEEEEEEDFLAEFEILPEHAGTMAGGTAPVPSVSAVSFASDPAVIGESQLNTSTHESSGSLESVITPTGFTSQLPADSSGATAAQPAVPAQPTHSLIVSTSSTEASQASSTTAPGGGMISGGSSSTGKRSVIALSSAPPQAEPPLTVSKRESYLRDQQAVKRKMMVVESAKRSTSTDSTAHAGTVAGYSNSIGNNDGPSKTSVPNAAAAASDSDVRFSATTVVANQHVIKKRKVADIDTEESSPAASSSAQSASKAKNASNYTIAKYMSTVSVGSNASSGAVTPRNKCINAANSHMVAFIDECLSVMQRHRSTMESARINALNSRETIPREFANGLVEAMAGDIIQVVSQSLNMAGSESGSKRR